MNMHLDFLVDLLLPKLTGDSSELLNWIFFFLIFAGFFCALFRLLFLCFKQEQLLNKILSNLESESVTSVAINRLEIKERFSNSNLILSSTWHAFDSNLLTHTHDLAGNAIEPQLRNPMMAEDFFNHESLQISIGRSRLLAAAPAILAGVGVLGTFVGLLMGLVDLSGLKAVDMTGPTDLVSRNQLAGQLTTGIFGMIAGAATAFKTSVWGVMTSLIVNLAEKFIDGRLHNLLNRVQNRIDDLYCHIDLNEYLQSIEKSTRNSSLVISTLAEKIGDKMQESMERAGQTISQSLEASLLKIMTPALEKLANIAQDQVQKASASSQDQLEKLLLSFQQELEKAGKKQGDSIAQATDAMMLATEDMANKFGEISHELSASMKNMADGYAQSAKSVELSLKAQSETNAKLAETSAKDTETLFTDLSEMVMGLTDTIKQQMEEQRIANLDHKAALKAQIDEILTATNENIDLMQRSLSEKLQEEKSFTEVRNQEFVETVKQLHSMLDNVQMTFNQGNEAQLTNNQQLVADLQKLSTSFENLGQANERASIHLGEAATALNSTTVTFNSVSESIKGTIQRMSETVSETIRKVSEICNASEGNVELLTNSAKQLQETLAKMELVSEAISQAADQSDRSFTTLTDQFRSMMEVMRHQSEQFAEDLATQMEQYHDALTTNMDNRMNVWNEQTANYTEQMTDAIESIRIFVEEMDSRSNKRY